jgi:peptide/nickel transport system permease protein
MTPLLRVVRRLALAAAGFFGVTLVTFALLDLAQPVLRSDPREDPAARQRAALLADRYALDRPLFYNDRPTDAGGPLPAVDPAQVEAWLAAARAEASGRGGGDAAALRARAAEPLRAAGRGLPAALVPRLLDENAIVLGAGLDLLQAAAGIPEFPKPEGASRRALSPGEERRNEALRRSVALWWRRHGDAWRDRGALWHAAVGRITQTRYAAWLGDLVRLDFGDSLAIQPETPVSRILKERLLLTALVMGLATIVLFAVGVPLGIACAANRGGMLDRIAQGVLFFLHATPESWIATLALVYLASDVHVRAFPVAGLLSPEVAEGLATGGLAVWSPRVLLDAAHHLVLPVLVLAIPAWVVVVRHVRANAIEVLGSRFVTAARARGIPRRRILFVHVLRNVAPPTVALFTSVLPALVTGSILVEVLFSLDGMGLLSWQAATTRDFPVGMAILVLVALVMLVAHAVCDLIHAFLDPRTRSA